MRICAVFAITAVGVAGCASTSSVVPIGPGTFHVSAQVAPVRGGVDAARPLALKEAAAFCASRGQQVVVKTIEGADVTFRCLSVGDAELKQPNEIKRRPDIVIEQR